MRPSPLVVALLLGASLGCRSSGQGGARVDFAASVGKKVVVEGRVSRVPWQHLVLSLPGRTPEYFDPDSGPQIVVYSATPLPAGPRLRLTGTVLRAGGPPKRPGSKIDDPEYVEYQLDVSSWVELAAR